MNERGYTCAACGGEFTDVREDHDDKSRQEAKAIWGEDTFDRPMDLVCDVCYHRIMAWVREQAISMEES